MEDNEEWEELGYDNEQKNIPRKIKSGLREVPSSKSAEYLKIDVIDPVSGSRHSFTCNITNEIRDFVSQVGLEKIGNIINSKKTKKWESLHKQKKTSALFSLTGEQCDCCKKSSKVVSSQASLPNSPEMLNNPKFAKSLKNSSKRSSLHTDMRRDSKKRLRRSKPLCFSSLLETNAGKMHFIHQSRESLSPMVVFFPDTRPGKLVLANTEDSSLYLLWIDQETGKIEDSIPLSSLFTVEPVSKQQQRVVTEELLSENLVDSQIESEEFVNDKSTIQNPSECVLLFKSPKKKLFFWLQASDSASKGFLCEEFCQQAQNILSFPSTQGKRQSIKTISSTFSFFLKRRGQNWIQQQNLFFINKDTL